MTRTTCEHTTCTASAVIGTVEGWLCAEHGAQQHLAASLLRRAAELRDSGDEVGAVGMEEQADMVGATCPACGHDLLGAFPVDGRDVDRAPESPGAQLGRESIEAHRRQLRGEPDPPLSEHDAEVLALLTPGSYEVPAEMERRFGRDVLDAISRPTPADQIRRDEATRKALDNHEEN